MHILIVGGGRLVYFLARNYLAKGDSTTLVNRNREECERLAKRLPGAKAQSRYAPELAYGRHAGPPAAASFSERRPEGTWTRAAGTRRRDSR